MKVLEWIRIIWSGNSLRGMDDQGQIGRETTRTYMTHFIRDITEIFGSRYL